MYKGQVTEPSNVISRIDAAILVRDQKIIDPETCLVYTTDAANDLPCLDLVGRRINQKKKNLLKKQTGVTTKRK